LKYRRIKVGSLVDTAFEARRSERLQRSHCSLCLVSDGGPLSALEFEGRPSTISEQMLLMSGNQAATGGTNMVMLEAVSKVLL
jgi:hypothetical protein